MRRILAMVLALCMTVLAGAVFASAATGSCGSGVTWTYDAATTTLTVSGSGAMEDYYGPSYTPWQEYRSAVTAVVIGEGVTAVGNNAFHSFVNLRTVSIGSGVERIGSSAFLMCGKLESISVPAATKQIGSAAFFGCAKLSAISVAQDNSAYTSDGGVLYNKSMTTLIQAPGGLTGSYRVADTVTKIGDQAFFGCSGLTGLTLPESLQTVGEAAFQNCTKLKSVAIPNSVSAIGEGAFRGCSALSGIEVSENNQNYSSDASGVLFDKAKTVLLQAPGGLSGSYTLPASVTAVADSAFWYCESVWEVNLQGNVQALGKAAFASCSGLESITLSARLTVIPEDAFSGCFSLRQITVPAGVTEIESSAFTYCEALETVRFLGDAPKIAGDAFTNVYADAYYPKGNATWTSAKQADYGGELTWAEDQNQRVPFELAGVNLALNNDITLYLYVMAENYDPGYTMEITKSYADGREVTKTVAAADWENYYGTMYRVGFNGIAAKEMTDEITVTVYDASGNAVSKEFVTTVADAAVLVYKSEANAASFTMMADLLNYGAAAQGNFRYNTDDLANTRLTAEQAAYASARFDMSTVTGKASGTAGAMGATLYLDTNIQHNFIFDAAVVDSTMTAKVSYTNYKGVANSFTIPGSRFVNNGSMITVNVSALTPADVNVPVTVQIVDANGAEVCSLTDSIAWYCVRAQASATNNLFIELMEFATSCNAYFG